MSTAAVQQVNLARTAVPCSIILLQWSNNQATARWPMKPLLRIPTEVSTGERAGQLCCIQVFCHLEGYGAGASSYVTSNDVEYAEGEPTYVEPGDLSSGNVLGRIGKDLKHDQQRAHRKHMRESLNIASCILVELVWWFFVQFDEAGCLRFCFITDCSSFVEFEEGGGVDLPQLALSWSQSPLDLQGRSLCRENRGRVAEELVIGVELSMDLKSNS